MKITFDFNCIIDLESFSERSDQLRRLIEYHNKGKIDIAVPGIAASELLKNGSQLINFVDFQTRIKNMSDREIDILPPMAYWDFTYWDHCIWSDSAMEKLDKEIHSLLFPTIPILWRDFVKKNDLNLESKEINKKWRNARCDTISMWCHIYYQRDIFVTSDNNFLSSKKPHLIALGAKAILKPFDLLTQM